MACVVLAVVATTYMSPLLKTMGAVASRTWLEARGIDAKHQPAWYLEIQIYADVPETRLELNLYPEEWGFVFRYKRQHSSIRVTDVAFVHGADDMKLLGRTPSLDRLAELLSALEQDHAIKFDFAQAAVRTNLDEQRTTEIVRAWFASP